MNDDLDISHLMDKLSSDPDSWISQPIISVTQITPSGLNLLYETADSMRTLVKTKGGDSRLAHKVLATIFYEASTRTSCSFQVAMMRLGGQVMMVDASPSGNTSSKKGETVTDTVKCLQCYTDVTVMRHPTKGTVAAAILKEKLNKPLINAGDGTGEHPTQALLDLFTIVDELDLLGVNADKCDPIVIVLLGDLKHGRTVHSLAKLMARCQAEFLKRPLILRYCSPTSLQMPSYIKDYVGQYSMKDGFNIAQEEVGTIDEALQGAHVLYVTRVQKERFASEDDYLAVKGQYIIDEEVMNRAPAKMIVMHPLPRVDEISPVVDDDPRAAYFRQMENGLFVRMSILALVLGRSKA
jgi:carbamoyl-phosphate synthase/aspartate carbamoyltransferase/dihydroorotase